MLNSMSSEKMVPKPNLFYFHLRPPPPSLIEGNDEEDSSFIRKQLEPTTQQETSNPQPLMSLSSKKYHHMDWDVLLVQQYRVYSCTHKKKSPPFLSGCFDVL